MLKVGIIGAGSISRHHLKSFAQNPNAQVIAVADVNEGLAMERAEEFGITNYYSDYKKILADTEIDAVSIITPTFTHCGIVTEALKAGKQVLCEKPPAMTVKETKLAVETAKETGKLLMWAFVCRFQQGTMFLKDYITSGKMGMIYQAEAIRMNRYDIVGGWFSDKSKAGGGDLIDGAIHQIDEVMYLMGYPKVKEVLGFTTCINNDLEGKIKGQKTGYVSSDKKHYERTIESMASGYVTFDNGACLYIKSGGINFSVSEGIFIELIGKESGARMEKDEVTLLSSVNDYMVESKPIIKNNLNPFDYEIDHFVDCCINNTPCICEGWQAVELMKVIEGIYKSAETGKIVSYEI